METTPRMVIDEGGKNPKKGRGKGFVIEDEKGEGEQEIPWS